MMLGQYINMNRILSIVNRYARLNRSIRLNIVSRIFVSFIVSASCFILYGCCGDGTGPGYSASGYFVALFSPQAQTIEIQATNEEYTDISIDTPTGFWYFSEYDHGGTIYEPNTYTYYRHACHYRVHNPTENTEPMYMYAKGMGLDSAEIITVRGIPSNADTFYDLESDDLAADLMYAYPYDVQQLLDFISEAANICLEDSTADTNYRCATFVVIEPGESASIYFKEVSSVSIPDTGGSYTIARPDEKFSLCGTYSPHEVRCSE